MTRLPLLTTLLFSTALGHASPQLHADGGRERLFPPGEEWMRPDRHHVRIYDWAFDRATMNIRFYDNRQMIGEPVIHLTNRGLFIDGTLVCSWPDGRFNPSSRYMWLGFEALSPEPYDAPPSGYRGCPSGVPIETLYDFGAGTRIVIAVVERRESIAAVEYGMRKLFLDLDALPGDPRPETVDTSFALQPKGSFEGWAWHRSDDERKVMMANATEALLRSPAFIEFRQMAKDCLNSPNAPDCLAAFVRNPFYYPEAMSPTEKSGYVPALRFARYARTASHPYMTDKLLWAELDMCFSLDSVRLVDKREEFQYATVKTDNGFVCGFRYDEAGWQLSDVKPVRYPLPPVDEAIRYPKLVMFRDDLIAALTRGDYDMVANSSTQDAVQADLAHLVHVLKLGGRFTVTRGAQRGRREFCAPYFYTTYPRDAPAELRGGEYSEPWIVHGEDVPLLTDHDDDAPAVAYLTNELVKPPDRHYGEWDGIDLSNGLRGWLKRGHRLYDPHSAHIACFAQINSRWIMTVYKRTHIY